MFNSLYETDAIDGDLYHPLISKEDFLSHSEKIYEMMKEINAVHNLTRITSDEDFWNKHWIDSLLIAKAYPAIMKDEIKVADIGCGGGYPCLPLAAVNSNLTVVGIDGVGKKVHAVQQIADALGFSHLSTVHGKARELARKEEFNEQFDLLTARAVAETGPLLKECRQLLKKGGVFILYKTPMAIEKESQLTEREAKKFKFELSYSDEFELNGQTRQFVFATKL